MDAFLLYILKSGICLTVFYVCFKALFSNDTFFRFNRWILLVGTGVCMLLPLCRIQTARPFPLSRPVSQLEIVFYEEEMKAFPVPESKEEITIPGTKESIGQILFTDISERKLELRPGQDELIVRGELFQFGVVIGITTGLGF